MSGTVIVKGFTVPLSSDDVELYGFKPVPREHSPRLFKRPPVQDDFYHSDCETAGEKGLVNTSLNKFNQMIAAYCPGPGEGTDWTYYYHPSLSDDS